METFPKFDLFPRISKVARGLADLTHFLPRTVLAPHGDHIPTEKRGAAEMLDNAMDNQPELPFENGR